ncbi:MAG: lasso peptide biosynthesis protein [Oscillospiraceae bacterium]|nr:lasso peptide biosynthesis protein [Oscillospiraceae bacterium]
MRNIFHLHGKNSRGGKCFKKKFLACILLCAAILSSCQSGGDIPSASVTTDGAATDSASAEVTVSAEDNEDTSDTENNSASETISDNDTESVSDTSEKISETEETENSPAESTSETETDSASEQASSVTETSASASETSPPVTETVAPQTTTTAAITAAKPAEIVIPDVKVPLANGASVFSEEKAEVDYGNASDGYISVVYNGSSAQAKLRIANGSVQYDHDISVGGKRDFIPLMGSGSYSVKVYEHISGKNFAPVLSGEFEVTLKNETDTYIYPNKYVNFSKSSACVKKAAEVCAGKSGDVEEIAAIFDYIADNISYDKQLAKTVQSGYIPDPDKTLASGKGICFDYASLFAAMCRSRGIPARLVIGYAEPNIYHAWNEVYTDETGWITPELFLKRKGYNITDATFYSSNSDKEKIAGYISDEKNYTAMYRY